MVDVGPDLSAGLGAGNAGHEQRVVAGVVVAYRGDDGVGDRVGVEGAGGGGAPDPAAAAGGGVAGDRGGAGGRAAREQPGDLRRQLGLELHVGVGAALAVTLAAPGAGGFVGQALPLGLFEGGVLDEKALPFVAFAGAAEAHDHGGQAAGLFGPAGQRGVAGG